MNLTIDVAGLEDFEDRLTALAELPGVDAELLRVAEDIRAQAIANLDDGTPPDSRTGTLAASLKVETDRAGQTVSIGTRLDYGAHLEFGTRNIPERPWFGPAVMAVVKDLGPRFRRVLADLAGDDAP